jgi:type I restriction enzyme, S subunit
MALKDKLFSFFDTPADNHSTSVMVAEKNFRLDSAHYLNEEGIDLSHLKSSPLSELIDNIVEPKLFTRRYCDKEYGVPYISSTEMSEIEPIPDRFISKELTSNLNDYIIRRGQVLVSAAGTVGSSVGRSALAPDYLNGVAGTSDILRINCGEDKYAGFIYIFLTSFYGQQAIANIAYGAIIKRVRGFQLSEMEVPELSEKVKSQIHELAFTALQLRENAHKKIQNARKFVYKYNNLPPFNSGEEEIHDPAYHVPSCIISTSEKNVEFRLDAHYYHPLFAHAEKNVSVNAKSIQPLSELTENIFMGNRFTRNYVEPDFGVPFISTKNLFQIRPSDLKFLSSSEMENISELLIKRGWILIARSGSLGGTFGKVAFVWKNFEKYAATEDIVRIVPNPDEIDVGYLYAYLSCEYGYASIIRHRHGALIDHLAPEHLFDISIPIIDSNKQKEIGDLVRQAYDNRSEAIALEDKAQKILEQSLTK